MKRDRGVRLRYCGDNQYSGEGAPETGKDCEQGDELIRKMGECETE